MLPLPAAPAVPATRLLPTLAERLKSLRVLVAVAEHGSALRAAQAIHLSQPAVTRAVLELEKACQIELFVRASKGMVPTPMGAKLVQRTRAVFDHLAEGARAALAAAFEQVPKAGSAQRFAEVVSPSALRAMLAITSQGSEAKAAQLLGVTQPAVHAALHGLEQLLRVRLFYKLTQGTRLTPAGEALLRRVKLALAEIRAIESDIAAWRGDSRGRLVVGVLPLSVPLFLPRAVDRLLQQHPNIEVHIVDGTYESLMQQLLSADIDVIAGALRPGAVAPDVSQHTLFEDELVIVACCEHPCLAQPHLALPDLLQWEWVVPLQGTPASSALEAAFAAQGLSPPKRQLQATSPALTQAFVSQTERLAVASRGQALIEQAQGRLRVLPVPLAASKRRIGTVVRSAGEPAPHLRLLLQACQQAVA